MYIGLTRSPSILYVLFLVVLYFYIFKYLCIFKPHTLPLDDTGSVPANLWRQAILRGHGGATRRPELATRWRQRRRRLCHWDKDEVARATAKWTLDAASLQHNKLELSW